MTLQQLERSIKSFSGKRIAVIGDIMLDHYLWGKVDRISPEAPVPVVDIDREEFRLGGAANVVYNLKALDAIPIPLGIVGNDSKAETIIKSLTDLGVQTDFVYRDQTRPTTCKTRIIAHQQQIARVDYEMRDDIASDLENEIINGFRNLIGSSDAVIIEDYNKGLLTSKVIENVLQIALEKEIPVAVDPKFKNFFNYRKATLFKPNFLELQKNSDLSIDSEKTFAEAALKLLNRLEPEYLVVTRGDKGLSLFRKDNKRFDIPTFAREVYDVSGAGDTVISLLTLGICSGLTIENSALIANHAAGAVCGKIGIQPAYPKDIIDSFKRHNGI